MNATGFLSLEETMNKADEYFNGGYNCAESVLKAMADYYGLQNPLIPSIATPFGGGLSRMQMLCGAITGGLLVIGLVLGRDNGEQPRDPSYQVGQEFLNYFLNQHQSVSCRDITNTDFNDAEAFSQFRQDGHLTICTPLVKEVCAWLINRL